jgi:hypothetical protein
VDNHLVVADFGIAHFGEEELLTAVETKNDERLANFIYAAPEQKIRGGLIDQRVDIFALGLILNEMFTATVPLATGHPLIANACASYSYLDEIVGRMVLHFADQRYPSITKIKEELVGRGHAFVELQKLDEVRRTVVPASTPDDPLVGQDIKIVDFAFEPGRSFEQGELICFFNINPPEPWKAALHTLQSFRSSLHAHPTRIRFYPKSADAINGTNLSLNCAGT